MSGYTPFAQTITVKRKSQYGILVNNEWMNMDKLSGLKASMFQEGEIYDVEGTLAPEKDGKRTKFIKTFKPHNAPADRPIVPNITSPASAELTSTSTGMPPKVDYAAKADAKDDKITVLAIVKSVIESPLLPVLAQDSLSFRKVVEEESRYLLDMVGRIVEERSK